MEFFEFFGMVKTILIIAAMMGSGSAVVYSQDDSTRYIFGLPVTEDTVEQFLGRDLIPKENLQPVPFHKLPVKVRETLTTEDHYHGGLDSTIFFDKNTRLYIVYVETAEGMQIFGLNENGKPVTFNAISNTEKD